MCSPTQTMTTKNNRPTKMKMNARSKRRERRALLRAATSESSITSDDTQSTASCSITTCDSSLPTTENQHLSKDNSKNHRDQKGRNEQSKNKKQTSKKNTKHYQNNKAKSNKAKKSSKKNQNKKPIVVEIEDISEDEKAKYVALDCEMVLVNSNDDTKRVARVSIVNWYGETIMNKFVKVEEEVTDYLTFVSGVRQEDIESQEAITFHECREQVLNIIKDKIVVGHALKNDFQALNITNHPWHQIRDTAKYEPFMVASKTNPDVLVPRKLKVLVKNKLGMTIQEEGQMHDSIEDATAAMDLYIKARRKWEIAVEWKYQKTIMMTESSSDEN